MIDLQALNAAVEIVATEKKIPKEKLIEIIESAIKTAYKRDYASKESEVNVHIDMATGKLEISIVKEVVEEVEDEDLEISYEEIGGADSGYEIGDMVELDVSDDIESLEDFGRIAAQAAKNVIVQKMSETEKEKLYELFKDKE